MLLVFIMVMVMLMVRIVFILTSLDEIAWIMNLRGNDIAYNPVFLSYLVLSGTRATLYVRNKESLPVFEEAVDVRAYEDFYQDLKSFPAGSRIWLDNKRGSRFQNTWKNFRFGVAAQIVITLLGFVSRTIFIHVLSEDYLGVNGLYASILNVLSLTELGLSDIVVYSLYKPLAEGDEKQLTALMGYYKTIYRVIALAVAVIGLALVPVLRLERESGF